LYPLNNGLSEEELIPGKDAGTPPFSQAPLFEPDFVFKMAAGAYYGHPDPFRGKYALDANGSPTGDAGYGGDDLNLGLPEHKSASLDESMMSKPVASRPATMRLGRGLLRTERQTQALRSAVEAQIAADGKRIAEVESIHSVAPQPSRAKTKDRAGSGVTMEHLLASVLSRFSF
jgi:hypothetical protein